MKAKFGIPPEAFKEYKFYRRGHNIWIISLTELPNLRYESMGIRFLSTKGRICKPTTYALQLFGNHATKNIIDLDPDQAKIFIAGEVQKIQAPLDNGYVVVTYKNQVMGCGLYSRGELISQLPKERRITSDKLENKHLKDGL